MLLHIITWYLQTMVYLSPFTLLQYHSFKGTDTLQLLSPFFPQRYYDADGDIFPSPPQIFSENGGDTGDGGDESKEGDNSNGGDTVD